MNTVLIETYFFFKVRVCIESGKFFKQQWPKSIKNDRKHIKKSECVVIQKNAHASLVLKIFFVFAFQFLNSSRIRQNSKN